LSIRARLSHAKGSASWTAEGLPIAMYWPIGTPRIYATSSSRAPAFKLFVSHDGLRSPRTDSSDNISNATSGNHLRSSAVPDISEIQSPITPITPLTPGILSVEHDDDEAPQSPEEDESPDMDKVPLSDPILALRISRSGQLFAVITATSITIWQTKVLLWLSPTSMPWLTSTADRHPGSRSTLRSLHTNVWYQCRPLATPRFRHLGRPHLARLPHHLFDRNRRRLPRV
jgi:hypothetical protein